MSNYVLSFRGQSDRTPDADQEAAWGQWFQEISSTIADFGHRVGRVSALGNHATGSGTSQDVLAGYVVINADDLDAAVAVAKGCPGLQHGGRVEVGETVDMS
jgi:YCII-related domain-containing protein